MSKEANSRSAFGVLGRSDCLCPQQTACELKAKNSMRRICGGFSLIELLVVISIIGVLAGMILSTAKGIQTKGARSRAESEIKALEAALESYKSDNGDYPMAMSGGLSATNHPNSGVGPNSLYDVLCSTSGKVYFEFKKGMTNSSGIVDPWGGTNVYVYSYVPGGANSNGAYFFDLSSTAGGSVNQNSWIRNW